jgi:N-acetylmuramoyl-L-alanine amidase
MKNILFPIVVLFLFSCHSANETKYLDNLNYSVLSDKYICIDPGHQQFEDTRLEPIAPGSPTMKYKCSSGTSGIVSKVPEYVVVLDISIKLRRLLESYGVNVVMTRDNHDVNISNIERAEIGNNSQSDIMIRVHADGSTDPYHNGFSVLVPAPRYIKDNFVITESRSAGSSILQGIVKYTGAKNNGIIERDDLTGFNWSKIPVVLVETGFMTNMQEDTLLNSDDYQNRIAHGIVDGLTAYFSP